MPHFIIERNVGEVTEDELEESARRSMAVVAEMDGVVWIRSFISRAEGKIYCEYEAPSAEAVLEHARRAGLRADRVSLVDFEMSPSMFV